MYREAARPGDPVPAARQGPANPHWSRAWVPDEVMLFRYSALTFNSHRIHYDTPYVTGTEGYAGLVVHGPLQATLLLDLAHAHAAPGLRLSRFEYRALAPTFGGLTLSINGSPAADARSAQVWATGPGADRRWQAPQPTSDRMGHGFEGSAVSSACNRLKRSRSRA